MPATRFLVQPAPTTKLGEPEFDAEQQRVYADALDALANANVPNLVGGALAMNKHTGIWRDTKDLDLFLKPDDVDDALAALARAGFDTERVYASWLSKGIRGDLFVDLIHRNANGLHEVTDEWFEHAPRGRILDREVAFLAPEELFLSKSFVGGRYRYDGADLLHLVYALRGALDWERLADEAGEHAGLLLGHLHVYRWAYPAFAAYVPDEALARLEARARRDVARPPVTFRGRLYDGPSFDVDVHAWGLPDVQAENVRSLLGRAEWGTGMDGTSSHEPQNALGYGSGN